MLIETRGRAPRVLLVWPGTDGPAAGNFGVPQLVGLATYARERAGASVRVVDLAAERLLGGVSLEALFGGDDGEGWDVIGFSLYSSYDWLKIQALATAARQLCPRAVICAGGYHASARPAEVLGDASVFDVVVVGEGERPLARIIESVAGGEPLRGRILGSDPIEDLDAELPETDWSFLDRYRPIARRFASQAQIYLSRGCPFDCAFCMERAKREVSWRAFSPERAHAEMKRLDDYLDLSSFTLYVADALFGMRGKWRKDFLARLARDPVRAEQLWLLIRVDMVDEEDLRLFGAARCGLGFGLESGDPRMLSIARKAGRLDTYLERMREVSDLARELDVPWGANVICGHPGETEASLRTSAAYLRDLFLDPRGTTGFLSVDPFRLYPGSPIDAERAEVEAAHGTVFHRPTWWDDGDQELLSEWIDPSRELTYRRRASLQAELLGPVLLGIRERFVHRGPARGYFLRAVEDQIRQLAPEARLHFAGRHFAWSRYLGRGRAAARELEADREVAAICAELRRSALGDVLRTAEVDGEAPENAALVEALRAVPRERFVPLDRVAESALDVALPLDASGLATISAMHAYARAHAALGPLEGRRVVDAGAGSGYGAALLAHQVGAGGRVHAIEIDPALVARARHLASASNVAFREGDALDEAAWPAPEDGFDAAVLGFAVQEIPRFLARVLGPRAIVVAPVALADGTQRLQRSRREGDGWSVVDLGPVLYVRARRQADVPPRAPGGAAAPRGRRSLTIAR